MGRRGRSRSARFDNLNPRNVVAGVILLVLLLTIAGPRSLPSFVSNYIPYIDEAIPCVWLRQGIDRAFHQSLIGRAASESDVSPLSVIARSSAVPAPDGQLVITITVANNTIGTIPFVFNPDQVIVGDNNTSGLGLIFNPPTALNTGGTRQDTASYPEANIRLLGPRQRCIHRVAFPANQLDGTIASGQTQVRAYYRNNFAGQILVQNTAATPIYNDQGLWTGFIESASVPIPLAAQ
jgi:hypothetical protein